MLLIPRNTIWLTPKKNFLCHFSNVGMWISHAEETIIELDTNHVWFVERNRFRTAGTVRFNNYSSLKKISPSQRYHTIIWGTSVFYNWTTYLQSWNIRLGHLSVYALSLSF